MTEPIPRRPHDALTCSMVVGDLGDRTAYLTATAVRHDIHEPTIPAVRITIVRSDDSMDEVLDWIEIDAANRDGIVAYLTGAGGWPARVERVATVAQAAAYYEHARLIPAQARPLADGLALALRSAYNVHATQQKHGKKSPAEASAAQLAINGAAVGIRAVLAARYTEFDGTRWDALSFPWPETEELGWWD